MADSSFFPAVPFAHPKLSVPPPLMMSEPGSFAHYTLTYRWGAIARRTITENDFPSEITDQLEQLAQNVPDGQIRLLHDNGPDLANWQHYLTPFLGQSWLQVPWFFAEVYFYRRLLEATRYFDLNSNLAVDPFAVQKQASLEQAIDSVRQISAQLNGWLSASGGRSPRPAHLTALIYANLWGNRADLSLDPTATTEQIQQKVDAQASQHHILVDQTPEVVEYLLNLHSARIDLIADNAGAELFTDFALIDFLLATGIAHTITLHLKAHPTFVSDATIADVQHTLTVLSADPDSEVRSLTQRFTRYLKGDRLHLAAAPFWTEPLVFWDLSDALTQHFTQSDLVIIKGDANYRRLLGDCAWPLTMSFADIVCYFPAPLVALRTLKSEIAAGLEPAQIAATSATDPNWLINGHWGVIQASPLNLRFNKTIRSDAFSDS
ncbi:MAG TPA: damage-control phosphatase ARMT1 family protein [Crinalium sp.]|jgi:uncharacterized protein with ATP-grasp and redox domains